MENEFVEDVPIDIIESIDYTESLNLLSEQLFWLLGFEIIIAILLLLLLFFTGIGVGKNG